MLATPLAFLLASLAAHIQPPPTTLAELEEYMRTTVNKEIPRESLEFGPELGSGEFGAVYEGNEQTLTSDSRTIVAMPVISK